MVNVDFWIQRPWNRVKRYVGLNTNKMPLDSLNDDFFKNQTWLNNSPLVYRYTRTHNLDPNQSVLFYLLNAVCIAEKQQIPSFSHWVVRTGARTRDLHFESFTVATMTWLTAMVYLCHKWPRICSTRRKHFPVLSSCITRLTRRMSLVEQELLTIPDHLSSPPVFGVTRGLD